MPELRRDPIPPLSQDFFESLDKVDETALARLIIELNINRLQELPDLTSIFFRRRRQQHQLQQQQQQQLYGPVGGNMPNARVRLTGMPTMPSYSRAVGVQRGSWPVYG